MYRHYHHEHVEINGILKMVAAQGQMGSHEHHNNTYLRNTSGILDSRTAVFGACPAWACFLYGPMRSALSSRMNL